MSLQTPNGSVFDALVFGERFEKQWVAGSDHFRRSEDFRGEPEGQAAHERVHVAVVWHPDGRIQGFRGGKTYGRSYRKSNPVTFQAGNTVLTLGLRHLNPGGNRHLRGRIHEAQFFDRALDPGAIARLAGNPDVGYVGPAQVAQALGEAGRTRLAELETRVKTLELEIAQLSRDLDLAPRGPDSQWQELAHAFVNFKEFIYVR